jgi:calcium/calmodulin-dependent protein kinase I
VFVDFFGWFKDGSDVFLAMEYVPLGDLEKNVTAHSGRIPEIEARDITEQILLGLEIMHAESFAHRDLKPQVNSVYYSRLPASHMLIMLQNVLVVNGPPQWWVKLADFGLSKRLSALQAGAPREVRGLQHPHRPPYPSFSAAASASSHYEQM